MSKLNAGDKLVYQPEKGRFQHLEDPLWVTKLIVGGMTFFMGSPEEQLGGTWDCPGLTEAQARTLVEMIAHLQGLKVARSYEDDDEGGIVFVMEKGKRKTRYRNGRDWLSYSLEYPLFQHGRRLYWLEEWELCASWQCDGLTAIQVPKIAAMCADLLGYRAQRCLDEQGEEEENTFRYEFVSPA